MMVSFIGGRKRYIMAVSFIGRRKLEYLAKITDKNSVRQNTNTINLCFNTCYAPHVLLAMPIF